MFKILNTKFVRSAPVVAAIWLSLTAGKNLLNSVIIPAVRLSQIAATTGADLTNFVFRILNIFFTKF